MSLTDNKQRRVMDEHLKTVRRFNVAAGVKIFQGAMVGIDTATGLANVAATTRRTVGIARELYDNSASASATTDSPLGVESGQWEVLTAPAGFAAQNIGQLVYATADDTLTLTANANSAVGKAMAFVQGSTTLIYVDTQFAQG